MRSEYLEAILITTPAFIEQIVSHRLSFDLCVLRVCGGHSNWLDTLVFLFE